MSMDWTPIPIIVWFSIGLFTRRNSLSIIVALLNVLGSWLWFYLELHLIMNKMNYVPDDART